MTVIPTVLSVAAGICLFAGGMHLLFGLARHPRDWLYISFALVSLAIAANALSVLAIHTADSVDSYVAAFKYAFGPTALLSIVGILWFVALYTGVMPRWFLLAMSVWFTGIIALQLILPYGILFADVTGLRSITMPLGGQFVIAQATPHPWRLAVDLFFVVYFAFLLYAAYRQYHRGDRGRASLLAVAICLFLLSTAFDSLVDTGVIDSVYISEIAFLAFVVVMSFRLHSEVIRAESELHQYRLKLEDMVDERTLELQEANEQLALQIDSRMQTEEALRWRVSEMAGLNRIAHTLSTVAELPEALEQVCEIVAGLFSAQQAYIISPLETDAGMQILIGYQDRSGAIGPVPLPVPLAEMQYFRRVLNEAESLALTDIGSLPLAAPMHDLVTNQEIHSAMLVPLVVRGKAIGLLAVATDQVDRDFSPDQLRLAQTVAVDVAGAIENARLFEQAQAVAVSEERSRLARELHDSVTQILFSINLIALSLGRLWKRNPEMAERSTGELQRLTRGALAEMRTLLRELRPQTIVATELSTLLKHLSDGVAARHDIPVDLDVGQTCELPPEVHVALYRIGQEALSNITKHAEASRVAVELVCDDAAVRLTITDDGQGFDPNDVPAECMGLDIMRERAEAIAAAVTITSRPGAGTCIVVTWPIPPAAGDHAHLRDTTTNQNTDYVGVTPRGRPYSE